MSKHMNPYLSGIISSNSKILEEIYEKFYPVLLQFILKNNGSEDDAQDCFQEALIATYRRLQKENFEIKTTFNTYIFNVGKFIWFKKVKKKIKTSDFEDFKYSEIGVLEESLKKEQKYLLFLKYMDMLSQDCKRVFQFFFDGLSYKKIAVLMEYTGAEYARRKKYLCTKKLTEKIRLDPVFEELYI